MTTPTAKEVLEELLELLSDEDKAEPIDKCIERRLAWQAEHHHTLDPYVAANVAYVNCSLMFIESQREIMAKKLRS